MRNLKQSLSIYTMTQIKSVLGLALALSLATLPLRATDMTIDLNDVALGARVLGMGKASVAYVGDSDTVYSNVGSAGLIETPKLGYTYTSILSDIGYFQLNGVYPTSIGTFGLSFVGVNVAGSYSATLGSGGQIVQGSTEYGYGSSIFMASFAKPLLSNLSVGVNLKYLTQSISGGSDSTSAAGLTSELGANYTLSPQLSLGGVYRGLLRSPLTWSSGQSEVIPGAFQVGASYQYLAAQDSLIKMENLTGRMNMDLEFDEIQSMLFHAGTEVWLGSEIALRAGFDQTRESAGSGTTTLAFHPALGAGIRVNGMAVDYAYGQNSLISGADTHLLTLGYVGLNEKPKAIKANIGNHIDLSLGVQDKVVVYDRKQVVGGYASKEVSHLEIANRVVKLADDGRFYVPIDMLPGRNVVRLKAYDANNNLIDAKYVRVLVKATFADLGTRFWAKDVIEEVATVGLVNGYPDGTFGAEKQINRAEITTLLSRSKAYDLDETKPSLFRDVSMTSWSKKYINAAFSNHLVQGYPNGTFQPNRQLSRAEGVTLFVRFQGEPTPANIFNNPFWDVPKKHWAAAYVVAGKDAGLVNGYPDGSFKLESSIVRAEAVKILANTKYGQQKILELYDWDTYLSPDDIKIQTELDIKKSA